MTSSILVYIACVSRVYSHFLYVLLCPAACMHLSISLHLFSPLILLPSLQSLRLYSSFNAVQTPQSSISFFIHFIHFYSQDSVYVQFYNTLTLTLFHFRTLQPSFSVPYSLVSSSFLLLVLSAIAPRTMALFILSLSLSISASYYILRIRTIQRECWICIEHFSPAADRCVPCIQLPSSQLSLSLFLLCLLILL